MNPKMTTNYYKILEVLYENQIQIGNDIYCPLTQDEIAKIIDCNRMTVCNMLKSLKEDGYVENIHNKQYMVTKIGADTVKRAKRIR